MAPSTIRKAIGAVKDQTSISIAKVAGNMAPDLEVLVVKATSHDQDPADDKYIREIISLTSSSRGYVAASVAAVLKRLGKTRDWIVALKALMLAHRLLVDGHPLFVEELVFGSGGGGGRGMMKVFNMEGFRDEAHSNSWDHTGFVRCYGAYLDEKVESLVFDRMLTGKKNAGDDDHDGFGGESRECRERDDFDDYGMRDSARRDGRKGMVMMTPMKEMEPEKMLGRLNQLLRILDRVLALRPTGLAKNTRLVIVGLYQVVKESFGLYVEICEALAVLLDRFTEMEYGDCVKGFNMYVNAAKLIDELGGFYGWCKDTGIARSSEYPEVKKITDNLLKTLEGFLKGVKGVTDSSRKSPDTRREEASPVKDVPEVPSMNEIKALPAPKIYATTAPPQPRSQPQPQPQPQHVTQDLVDLREDGVSADEQGNKLALALFSGPPPTTTNGDWEEFPSNGGPEITSAWQTPAAESGKADWELALVETASNLSKQKAELAGGLDPLILNGMYDQGAVRQHVSTTQLSGGSASSVQLPGTGRSATPVLALPAPDGTVQPVGNQDPFAASFSVPPPSYVQLADMEKKQHLLVQEQHIWQQYGHNGMQGQLGLDKISGTSGYYGPATQPMVMPYGMMPQVSGTGQPGGYYYPHY
ncbi:hypothetical protein Tsubulata_007750 [Turnera subulata]|uniref:ENTH domain-containing protein n=1 Tax=Turnera subulata TaxID=218843 RepID=A0A9Q0JG06_9ROSI|nr:hypothetical protein Tsubulata_007750 [Turnera subulata]